MSSPTTDAHPQGAMTSEKDVESVESDTITGSEDMMLREMGYETTFKREFTSLSTFAFAFSVTGILAGIMATFTYPLNSGGPAAVMWCWFIGALFCSCIGLSVAEMVSAYPTNGGMYYAVKHVVPTEYVPIVAWVVGWFNLLGQIATSASVDYALATQILAAVILGTDGAFVPTAGQRVGITIGCIVFHGILNSFSTKWLARMTSYYTIINIGSIFAVIIALSVSQKNKNDASFVFTQGGNETGWSSDGFAFLLGLLSVAWTMTDYDATAHISEETSKANIRAPAAIVTAVVSTVVFGWILNLVILICMGDPASALNSATGLPVAQIYVDVVGKSGGLALIILTILVQNFTSMVCMQSCSRTIHTFARDRAFPVLNDFWAHQNSYTKTPIRAVWLTVVCAGALCLLDLASDTAIGAIFDLCSIGLDWSYAVPIICKVIFKNKTSYKPGPFNLGRFSTPINVIAFVWVFFLSIILCMPIEMPVDANNMNYTSLIAGSVAIFAFAWWFIGARKTYKGPAGYSTTLLDAHSNDFETTFGNPHKAAYVLDRDQGGTRTAAEGKGEKGTGGGADVVVE